MFGTPIVAEVSTGRAVLALRPAARCGCVSAAAADVAPGPWRLLRPAACLHLAASSCSSGVCSTPSCLHLEQQAIKASTAPHVCWLILACTLDKRPYTSPMRMLSMV